MYRLIGKRFVFHINEKRIIQNMLMYDQIILYWIFINALNYYAKEKPQLACIFNVTETKSINFLHYATKR